jgi:hypothetical protein
LEDTGAFVDETGAFVKETGPEVEETVGDIVLFIKMGSSFVYELDDSSENKEVGGKVVMIGVESGCVVIIGATEVGIKGAVV